MTSDARTQTPRTDALVEMRNLRWDQLQDFARTLERENAALRSALQGLHDDNADYLMLNKLGGYDNHWMKAARAALGGKT